MSDGQFDGGSYNRGNARYRGRGGGGYHQGRGRQGYTDYDYQGGNGRFAPPDTYYNQPPPPPGPRGAYQQQQGYQGGGSRFQDNSYYQGGGGGRFAGGGGGWTGPERGRGRHHSDRGRGPGGGGGSTWGRSSARDQQRASPSSREDEQLPQDIVELTTLAAHQKTITALAFEQKTQQLYTGSKDGTVKSFSCENGSVLNNVNVGGEVDSILVVEQYLFVGLHKETEGLIKYWNMSTAKEQLLTGHKGSVNTMVVAGSSLCSAGQDGTIRVWAHNAAADMFVAQAIIDKEQGGHNVAITCLTTAGNYLFSADITGNIKAWDLAAGTCAQTITKAHTIAVTSLMLYDSFILSCSMDGSIKVWVLLEAPVAGMVLKPEPHFTYTREAEEDQADHQQARRARPGNDRGNVYTLKGVLSMLGVSDPRGQPILMVGYINDKCVRLYELPTFQSRGVLPQVQDARALATIHGQLLIAGDSLGSVRIFQWKQPSDAIGSPSGAGAMA